MLQSKNAIFLVLLLFLLASCSRQRKGQQTSSWSVVVLSKPAVSRSFSALRAVSFSPDGSTLGSAGDDGMISLWDLDNRTLKNTLSGKSGKISSLCFSPTGKFIISAATASVDVWDVTSAKLVRRFKVLNRGRLCQFYSARTSPDGSLLAASSGGNNITPQVNIWRLSDGKFIKTLKGHQGKIRSVSFSLDGRLLLSVGYDSLLYVWDVATGKALRRVKGSAPFLDAGFLPDDTEAFCSTGDAKVKILDTRTGISSHRIYPNILVKSIVLSPDGSTLIGGCSDGSLKLWDVTTGKIKETIEAHPLSSRNVLPSNNEIVSVSVSKNGLIAASSFDRGIFLCKPK